jgi:hypothetical protein
MTRSSDLSGVGRLLHSPITIRFPHLGKIIACLSILGFAFLCYLVGAAVMFFHLPSYGFLYQAFTGGQAWHERGQPVVSRFTLPEDEVKEGVTLDKPGRTYDGFTLVTTTQGARATLLDMAGKVIHQWELPFSQAWANPPHVQDPIPDKQVHWFHCHLFPNGDLLAIYQAESDTPCGYGLVKLNKDGKLLWKYARRVHHDLDVDEQGMIYTLTEALKRNAPVGLDYLPTPYVADSVVVLSPDGQEVKAIPLDEAIRDSAYALLLATSIGEQATAKDRATLNPTMDSPLQPGSRGDPFHTNSVKILTPALAPKFPLFQAGQVLLSLRSLHTIAVLDLDKRSVIWAARGPWRIQHDAEFLDNGHLLIFDNHGWMKGCRIVEYDPTTQAIPWVYSDADASPFHAGFRGMKQHLPNGNTLIVDPDNGRLFEVTLSKELVWEHHGRPSITGARRYAAGELTFLQESVLPRSRPAFSEEKE